MTDVWKQRQRNLVPLKNSLYGVVVFLGFFVIYSILATFVSLANMHTLHTLRKSWFLERQIKSVYKISDGINVEWLLLLHHWPTLVPICKPDRLEEHSKLEENHRLFFGLSTTFSIEIESQKDYAHEPIKLATRWTFLRVKLDSNVTLWDYTPPVDLWTFSLLLPPKSTSSPSISRTNIWLDQIP